MDPVKRQYESYPYPARDPADEPERRELAAALLARELLHRGELLDRHPLLGRPLPALERLEPLLVGDRSRVLPRQR